MMGEPIVANGPVVTLDVSILLGLAGLDEIDADSVPGSPCQRHRADVLRTVIASDGTRFAAPLDDAVKRSDHALGWQREIDFNSQAFAVIVVDDVEQPDTASVGKLVVHEVHRPALVDRRRHGQWKRFLTHQSMARLDPQVQLELTVNPVDALVVPFVALHVAQVQEAQSKAPVALVVRQPYQPVGDDAVLCVQLGLVAVAGLADAKCLAGQSDRG